MIQRHHDRALCETCPLFKDGIFVPSSGPSNAPIVIVAESPGDREAMIGQPLVGPTGKVLEQTFGQITDTTEWFKTNAVSCFVTDKTKQKSPAALRACQPRLFWELDEHRASTKVIVSLGGPALQSIKNSSGAKISRERGIPFWSEWGTVVPTYHPAALFHNGAYYQDYVRDLELVPDILDGTHVEHRPPPIVHIADTLEKTLKAIDFLTSRGGLQSYDIETGSQIRHIRYDEDRITEISFSWGEGDRAVVLIEEFLDHPHVIERLRTLFSQEGVEFGAQNGMFDSLFLRMRWGFDARVDEDSLLLHYCLDERKGTHDLKTMSRLEEGAPDYESELKADLAAKLRERMMAYMARRRQAKKDKVDFDDPRPTITYADADPAIRQLYAGYDAAYTQRLILRYRKRVREEGLEKLYRFLLRASAHLVQMQQHGILIDEDYRKILDTTLTDELARIEAEIIEYTWEGFNANSTQQTAKALFTSEYCDLIPPRDTRRNKDGNWSTAKSVLEGLTDQHPLPRLLLTWKSLKKLKSSYVDNLVAFIHRDGRVRPSVKLHGTVTGRPSASDPAVMTLPKPDPKRPSIRDLVITRALDVEGVGLMESLLLETDYSQGELRVMAAYSAEPKWVKAFWNNEDLHQNTMLECGLGDMNTALEEAGGDPFVAKQIWENKRKKAKNTAFGTLYGLQYRLLAKMFRWTEMHAKRFLADYWSAYPVLEKKVQSIREEAWKNGFLVSPVGRVRRYGLITPELKHSIGNEASNFFPQSILSDCTLTSMMDLMDWCRQHDDPRIRATRAIIFVYDSILLEVVKGVEMIVAQKLREIMESVPRRIMNGWWAVEVPFRADFKIGMSWGKMRDLDVPIQQTVTHAA